MTKTKISTNGEAPVEARERHHPAATPDYERNGSPGFDQEYNRSAEEKKRSLFRRPLAIVAAAGLAILGISYGAFAMFHSFTNETTDDAFIDVHTVSVAPKVAGHVAVVRVDDNQLVKKGDVLVEIDPRDFQVALAQTHRPAAAFLDRLGKVCGIAPPREPGLGTVATIEAMQRGEVRSSSRSAATSRFARPTFPTPPRRCETVS